MVRGHRFERHMVNYHLSEESCDICGAEIPARGFRQHWEYCDGDSSREIVEKVKNEKCENDCAGRIEGKSVMDTHTSNVVAETDSNILTLNAVGDITRLGGITRVEDITQ